MTEAEIIETINKKRIELEGYRSNKASESIVKALEAEIADLEGSLSNAASAKKTDRQVFLDECAG